MYSIIVSNQKYASTKQTNKRNNANEIKWQTLKSRGIFYSFLIFLIFQWESPEFSNCLVIGTMSSNVILLNYECCWCWSFVLSQLCPKKSIFLFFVVLLSIPFVFLFFRSLWFHSIFRTFGVPSSCRKITRTTKSRFKLNEEKKFIYRTLFVIVLFNPATHASIPWILFYLQKYCFVFLIFVIDEKIDFIFFHLLFLMTMVKKRLLFISFLLCIVTFPTSTSIACSFKCMHWLTPRNLCIQNFSFCFEVKTLTTLNLFIFELSFLNHFLFLDIFYCFCNLSIS